MLQYFWALLLILVVSRTRCTIEQAWTFEFYCIRSILLQRRCWPKRVLILVFRLLFFCQYLSLKPHLHVTFFIYSGHDCILADGVVLYLFFFEFWKSKVLEVDTHYLVAHLYVFKLAVSVIPIVAIKLLKSVEADLLFVKRTPKSQDFGFILVKRFLEQLNFFVKVYQRLKKSTVLFYALRSRLLFIWANGIVGTNFSGTAVLVKISS